MISNSEVRLKNSFHKKAVGKEKGVPWAVHFPICSIIFTIFHFTNKRIIRKKMFFFSSSKARKRFEYKNHFSYLMLVYGSWFGREGGEKNKKKTAFRKFETIWLYIKPTEIVTEYCLLHSLYSCIYIMMVICIWCV